MNTGDGRDDLLWNGGNIGALAMGADDDTAQFVNLTPANLTSGVTVDGGLGDDRLLWNNTKGAGVGRYLNWELFQLTNGSQLTFSGTLTLGDTITGSGVLDIDPSSTVFAGAGSNAIVPFTGGRLAEVVNAGTIDLTNGGDSTTDRLAITGNYFGADGQVRLQTVLASDGSPSDRLVIDKGTASGSTLLFFTDVGGGGAPEPRGDGILVVERSTVAQRSSTSVHRGSRRPVPTTICSSAATRTGAARQLVSALGGRRPCRRAGAWSRRAVAAAAGGWRRPPRPWRRRCRWRRVAPVCPSTVRRSLSIRRCR